MVNSNEIALAAYYGRTNDFRLFIKLFESVGLQFMDNLLFVDLQYVSDAQNDSLSLLST